MNDDYQLTTFTFGSHELQLFCLQSASTDYDLTGQLVWPGARLMNDYLSKNSELMQGRPVIELGSGVGITGILRSRFCQEVVLTDHNDEVLKILSKNIELHTSSISPGGCAGVRGFQHISIPPLLDTALQLLHVRGRGNCKFILAYVSRAQVMDTLVISEANRRGMLINEVADTRSVVGNHEGVIFEIILP